MIPARRFADAIVGLSLLVAAPASAWYNPLNAVAQDGAPAGLVLSTPYLPVGGGNCRIYPYYYYGVCAHPAYDLASTGGAWRIYGEPVHAAEEGAVLAIDPDSKCGLDVAILHDNGIVTRYCHLSGLAELSLGQRVQARAVIGYVGDSGAPGQPHLHFEAREGSLTGAYLDLGDPLSWPTEAAPSCQDYVGVRCGGYDQGTDGQSAGRGCGGRYEDVFRCRDGSFHTAAYASADWACLTSDWCR